MAENDKCHQPSGVVEQQQGGKQNEHEVQHDPLRHPKNRNLGIS